MITELSEPHARLFLRATPSVKHLVHAAVIIRDNYDRALKAEIHLGGEILEQLHILVKNSDTRILVHSAVFLADDDSQERYYRALHLLLVDRNLKPASMSWALSPASLLLNDYFSVTNIIQGILADFLNLPREDFVGSMLAMNYFNFFTRIIQEETP